MKISQKLTLGFFIIVIIVGLAGYFSIKISREALYDSIGVSLKQLAIEAMNEIDRNIYHRLEQFLVHSKDLLMKQALLQSNEKFDQLQDPYAYVKEKDKQWRNASKEAVAPFMQEIMSRELSKELKEKVRFYEKEYGYNVIGEIFLTNKYGANVAQTGKTTDYRQDDETWWQETKQNGIYVDDVQYDESADVHSLDICIRIDDEQGYMLGILKVVFNIQEVIEILKELEKEGVTSGEHKTLEFKLVNREGNYIYSSEKHQVFQQLPESLREKIFGKDKEIPYYWIKQGDDPTEGEELITYATSRGFKKFNGLGWRLVAEKETKEILAPVERLKQILGGILLAIITIIITIAVKSYQNIATPLRGLEKAIGEIQKGNLDIQLEVKSSDEVGFLADSFNKMTKELNNSRNSLLKTNQELRENEQSLRNTLDELQKAHEDLKQTELQLLQSEKLASIGQLAAGVAHEINNPLGFMISNLHSLKEYLAHYTKAFQILEKIKVALQNGQDDQAKILAEEMVRFEKEVDLNFIIDDVDKLLNESQGGIERIKTIVADLKTFTHSDQDTMEKLKIETIVDSVLDIVGSEIKYKAELKKNYEKVSLIEGNQQRLGQVFINLFINAVHAIEEKGIIEVKIYEKEKYVCVDVKDNGKGIAEKDLKNIFDPFYTTKPVGQGTGLGLSISYDIIKKHGGELKVDSQIGYGTTFTIMIPMVQNSGNEKREAIDGRSKSTRA